ncbi:hypothetical protein P3X46_010579, partial [Hevea brasiliensis]
EEKVKSIKANLKVALDACKSYADLKRKEIEYGVGDKVFLKRDIADYVTKCLTCQQVKAEHQVPSGLLQPIRIPEWKWDRVTMDFVSDFPLTRKKHDAVWVMVDRLTKSAHFLPVRTDYSLEMLAELYISEIVRLHGIPLSIISDRDPREQVEEPNKAKKTIAFKVSSENSSDEDDEFDEEEFALMTRRIRKMLFQNKKFIPKRNFKKDKGESSKRDPPICFECNKLGHIRMDCPKLKKPFKKFKKKALKATWDESSDSEDEEIGDQVAQMCFMAMEESSNEVTINDDVVEFSYDELVNALKVMNDELELRKDKLNAILDFQRSPSIKYGLGYSKFAQATPSKTIFVKASSYNEPNPKVCLKSSKLESKWYLDSGCSRHITENANLFLSLEKKDGGGQVTFSDNGKVPYQKVQKDLPKNWKFKKNHPKDLIIGDTSKGVTTRSSFRNICNKLTFISQIEPKSIDETINDES